jgi:hypothetical protein
MKKFNILLPFLLLSAGACESVFEQTGYFQVPVDSIAAPDTVSASAAVQVTFFGTIGENRCWAFHRFRTVSSSSRIELKVIARYEEDRRGCTPGTVTLDGVTYTVEPPHAGDFRIVVAQPERDQMPLDSLVHVVHVR